VLEKGFRKDGHWCVGARSAMRSTAGAMEAKKDEQSVSHGCVGDGGLESWSNVSWQTGGDEESRERARQRKGQRMKECDIGKHSNGCDELRVSSSG